MHLVFVSERTEGRAARAGRRARRRAPRVGRCPPAGSEREVLPGAAQAVRGDHRKPEPAAANSRRHRWRCDDARAPLLALLVAFAPGAFAHEVRPAYLELRQTGPETYDVLWKVPGSATTCGSALYVDLPAGSTNLSEPRGLVRQQRLHRTLDGERAGGLTGGTIHIDGLSATAIDVLVRVERLDGSTQVTRLTPSAPSFVVEATPEQDEVARTLPALGIEHILTGIDHLLFVLALLIITRGSWTLVKTVTAFTVAHSITLSLAALGFRPRAAGAGRGRHRVEHRFRRGGDRA